MSNWKDKLGEVHLVVMGVFLAVILIVSLIIFLGPEDQIIAQGPGESRTEERAAPPEEALGLGPERGFVVRDYSYDAASNTIVGTLANDTAGLYGDVDVTLNLVSAEGDTVRTLHVLRSRMAPGEHWEFTVDVPANVEFDQVVVRDIEAELIDEEQTPEVTEPAAPDAEDADVEDSDVQVSDQ